MKRLHILIAKLTSSAQFKLKLKRVVIFFKSSTQYFNKTLFFNSSMYGLCGLKTGGKI